MVFGWLRKRRRGRLLAEAHDPEWPVFLEERLPFYKGLTEDERGRLLDITRVVVAEKHWEGCNGLEVTWGMKVAIAAQASLLLLNIDHGYFRDVHTVLIYPQGFVAPLRSRHGVTVMEHEVNASGMAHYGGPIALAWDHVKGGISNDGDGHNVVLHEFAHHMDMLDHWVDGTPPLQSASQRERWVEVMTAEFKRLRDESGKGRKTVMRAYGGTNPAEFFAVATEAFFEKSRQMRKKHEGLYVLLKEYYGQDPAERD